MECAELDPLFLTNLSNLVAFLGVIGEFQDAEALARRIQSSHPGHPVSLFGMVLWEQGRLAEAVELLGRIRAGGDDRRLPRLVLEQTFYLLGDYARALEVSVGFTEPQASIGLEREVEDLAAVRARVEASPGDYVATWGLMHGLALAGRHRELLDWVAGRWIGPAELDAMFPCNRSRRYADIGCGAGGDSSPQHVGVTPVKWIPQYRGNVWTASLRVVLFVDGVG